MLRGERLGELGQELQGNRVCFLRRAFYDFLESNRDYGSDRAIALILGEMGLKKINEFLLRVGHARQCMRECLGILVRTGNSCLSESALEYLLHQVCDGP